MSEPTPDIKSPQFQPSQGASDKVAIAAIIAIAFVTLACILSCTILGFVFFTNPPW